MPYITALIPYNIAFIHYIIALMPYIIAFIHYIIALMPYIMGMPIQHPKSSTSKFGERYKEILLANCIIYYLLSIKTYNKEKKISLNNLKTE
jgi:hypothetical protein